MPSDDEKGRDCGGAEVIVVAVADACAAESAESGVEVAEGPPGGGATSAGDGLGRGRAAPPASPRVELADSRNKSGGFPRRAVAPRTLPSLAVAPALTGHKTNPGGSPRDFDATSQPADVALGSDQTDFPVESGRASGEETRSETTKEHPNIQTDGHLEADKSGRDGNKASVSRESSLDFPSGKDSHHGEGASASILSRPTDLRENRDYSFESEGSSGKDALGDISLEWHNSAAVTMQKDYTMKSELSREDASPKWPRSGAAAAKRDGAANYEGSSMNEIPSSCEGSPTNNIASKYAGFSRDDIPSKWSGLEAGAGNYCGDVKYNAVISEVPNSGTGTIPMNYANKSEEASMEDTSSKWLRLGPAATQRDAGKFEGPSSGDTPSKGSDLEVGPADCDHAMKSEAHSQEASGLALDATGTEKTANNEAAPAPAQAPAPAPAPHDRTRNREVHFDVDTSVATPSVMCPPAESEGGGDDRFPDEDPHMVRPGAERVLGRAPGQLPGWHRRLRLSMARLTSSRVGLGIGRSRPAAVPPPVDPEVHVADAELAPSELGSSSERVLGILQSISERALVVEGEPFPSNSFREQSTAADTGCAYNPCQKHSRLWPAILVVLVAAVAFAVAFVPKCSHGRLDSMRLDSIKAVLQSLTSAEALEDPASPQHRALIWLAHHDSHKVSPQNIFHLVQRFALATLFFATGGGEGGWLKGTNFLSSDHVCHWNEEISHYEHFGYGMDGINLTIKGAICSGDDVTVNGVLLHKNNLTGSLPTELGLLLGLEDLKMFRNGLTGRIPGDLMHLSELRALELQCNDLTGTIPSTIGSLRQLRLLHLFRNGFSGSLPASITNLSRLETMGLYENRLTGSIPESIGQMANIFDLLLGSNKFTGSLPWSLNRLKNLKRLLLSKNELTGDTSAFTSGSLLNLTGIWLGYNHFTGTIPAAITTYKNLQNVSFHRNYFTGTLPTQLGTLSRLELLSFKDNLLSGTIPSSVAKAKSLRRINLSNNGFNGTIPTDIQFLLSLYLLDLSYNNLTGTFPMTMGNLANLTDLFLSANPLWGSLPDTVGNMRKLESLALANNSLSGELPRSLSGLTALSLLDLGGNSFTGDFNFLCNHTFVLLKADCEEVNCSCCNACCKDNDWSGPVFGCHPT